MKTLWVVVAAATLSFGAAGCKRVHIREDYGKRTDAFFQQQRVHPEAASGSPSGLDSEEAGLIHARYRQTLGAPKPTAAEPPSRVLLVEDPRGNK